MTRIQIDSISGQNFMSYENRLMEFGCRTVLKGRNKCGKTTSKHLVNWVLLNKNADGKAPDGIRPHDKNGKDTDHVGIVGEIVLNIDGREVKIQKVQKQIWRTDRKTKEQRFDGNINIIYVNDVEMKEKDFKSWFDRVIGEEKFMICSNANVFTSKNAKDRRDILFKMIPSYSNEEILELCPEFKGLESSLHIGTPEEINVEDAISAVKRRINGKGRGDKGLKGEQEAIPVRIDEVSKGICDVAEFEIAITDLKERVAALDKEEETLDQATKAFDEKSRYIMDLKFEQSEIVRKANTGLVEEKNSLRKELEDIQLAKKELENSLRMAEMDLRHAEMGIQRHLVELKKAQQEWKEWSAKEFDDSELKAIQGEQFDEENLICFACGQIIPEDRQAEARKDFEERKLSRLAVIEKTREEFKKEKGRKLKEISESGNKANSELKNCKSTKEEAEKKISECRGLISSMCLKLAEKEEEIKKLPEAVDLSDTAEYRKITAKIEEAEKAMIKMNNGSARRNEIKSERNQMISEIASYQGRIKSSHESQDRVEELKKELVKVGQKIADAQKELDLLEDFNRTKIEMITDKINENFHFVKFRMFRRLVNGDYEPCCEVLVNGTSYDGNLNTGDKLLAELDLLSTFQRINDVSVPVFLDSAGEVDPDRVPETDFQLIMLQRTDDNELTVEVIER